MAIKQLPQQFRLTIDLTRQEAAEILSELRPAESGFARDPAVHRLLDELEEITTFDQPGEGGEGV